MKQTVLISGAAKRIGRALAESFAARGWEVVLHCNNSREEADILSSGLRESFKGRRFPVVMADFSSPEKAAADVFARLSELGVKPDALINNASLFSPSTISETTAELLRQQMSVNFEAPFLLMNAFYHSYGKGSIINILDTRVSHNRSDYAAYSLSKRALMELTRMAALEWAPNIRVNAVAPGAVLPPPGKEYSYLSELAAQTPLRKVVEMEQLIDALWFLLSNSAVTGQIIYCDGGAHLNL